MNTKERTSAAYRQVLRQQGIMNRGEGSSFDRQNGTGRVLEDGCYLIRYVPDQPVADTLFFEGTARVMRIRSTADADRGTKTEIRAGADLYVRPKARPDWLKKDPQAWSLPAPWQWEKGPDADGKSIPIFPRALYRYYLEITKIMENVPAPGQVSIFMSIHKFEHDVPWPNPGSRCVCLQKPDDDKYKDKEYFEGNVLDQDSGEIVGKLSVCRISAKLRRAKVAIHRAAGVTSFPGEHLPKEDGEDAQAAWKKPFEEAGWQIDVDLATRDDLKLASCDGGKWTIGELQQALYAMRIRKMAEMANLKIDFGKDGELEKMAPQDIQRKYQQLAALPDPLDQEWLYQLLCVPRIDGFDRGVMFDTYGSDSENLPREGAAIAAEWRFGDDAEKLLEEDPSQKVQAEQILRRWEPLDQREGRERELQKVAKAYFRVGVHEIGHAMGLDHNFKDHGFMNTTDSIADDALAAENAAVGFNLQVLQVLQLKNLLLERARDQGVQEWATTQQAAQRVFGPTPLSKDPKTQGLELKGIEDFVESIGLRFEADDVNHLRFGPDVTVRPGTSYHDPGPLFVDVGPEPADGLALEVSPLLESVPFGAPVRMQLKITNTSSQRQQVPSNLSLKTGVICGSVVDPLGNERTFWPLKRSEDCDLGSVLDPGKSRTYAITLLRGPQKALFPLVGSHRVKVRASWQRPTHPQHFEREAIVRVPVYLEREATVRITPPVDENHRAAALKVLSTPDTLLGLALVGDQFTEGTEAIDAAVANPILRSHFAIIRAKLFLKGPHQIDPDAACDLIDESAVMSFDEIDSLCDLLKRGHKFNRAVFEHAALCLRDRIGKLWGDGVIEADRAEILHNLLESWLESLVESSGTRRGQQPGPPGSAQPVWQREPDIVAVRLVEHHFMLFSLSQEPQ